MSFGPKRADALLIVWLMSVQAYEQTTGNRLRSPGFGGVPTGPGPGVDVTVVNRETLCAPTEL